jgi:copper homeostasis protein
VPTDPPARARRALLEVIVETVADARESAIGGADRLEVVEALELGGLTPALDLVREIAGAVSLPLRVMVRGNSGYATNPGERAALCADAARLADVSIDGLVVGFAVAGEPGIDDVARVIGDSGVVPVTFHRAFDQLGDPLGAIDRLCGVPRIDRILTSGGDGPPPVRCARLAAWQRRAAGRLTLIAGGAVDESMLAEIVRTGCVREVHVGRLARLGGQQRAPVDARAVARIRSILDAAPDAL